MKNFTGALSLVFILVGAVSGTQALADEPAGSSEEAVATDETPETSPADGISVGAAGTLSNHGAGGLVIGEFRGMHHRVAASIGAFAPHDGSDARLIGNLGGLYCFTEGSEIGVCLGAPDLLQSNGSHSQIGLSPLGAGFISDSFGSVYIAPRYAYVFDEVREIDMHTVGLEGRADFNLVGNQLLLDAVIQVGIGFGAQGQSSVPVVREVESGGYFVRLNTGVRWQPIDNLVIRGSFEVSDAVVVERRDGDITPTATALVGNLSAQYAF